MVETMETKKTKFKYNLSSLFEFLRMKNIEHWNNEEGLEHEARESLKL